MIPSVAIKARKLVAESVSESQRVAINAVGRDGNQLTPTDVQPWNPTLIRFAARRQLVVPILVLISCQLASRSDLNFLPTGLSGATAIALVQCGQSLSATVRGAHASNSIG